MGIEPGLSWLGDRERALWLLAISLYGVGDGLTTAIGLWTVGATEVGPVVGPMVASFGTAGLFLAKTVTIALFYLVWYVLASPARVAIPLAIAVVGAMVTGWNAGVIFVS
ncbi:hypothetical protein [Halovivax limisalsi]|uniref:hypothetical protein n=1 Tax=Halovivax limisalsi TaxID=1453760 RepID=UPI001FFC6602|nr:hypothetical protein [Halovivax limisalsi]